MATRDPQAEGSNNPLTEGVNLLNSVRIDTFYQALRKHVVSEIESANRALTPEERDYLRKHPGAVEKIRSLLTPAIGQWTNPQTLWAALERT